MITRKPRDQIIAESAKIGRSSWKHTCGASEVLYPVSPPHKSARDVKPDYGTHANVFEYVLELLPKTYAVPRDTSKKDEKVTGNSK